MLDLLQRGSSSPWPYLSTFYPFIVVTLVLFSSSVNYIARALYLDAIADVRAWVSSPYFLVEVRYYYTAAVKGHRALIRIIVAI